MADCRMVRRNSGETLQSATDPTQVLPGCVRSGNSSTNTTQQPSSAKLSYNCYPQNGHQQPQQYPNGSEYYGNVNGLSPGGSYSSSSRHYYHQQQQPQQQQQQQYHNQQFTGAGMNNYSYTNNQHQPHLDPPPRPWIQLSHAKHKRSCFTVLCYNILCSRYATHALYSYCPAWALDWNYRRKAILQELIHYAPDIICIQEMETDQFYNFFLPQLQLFGYSGIFAAKSRARTMNESKRRLVDGCAIFYTTKKFRLVREHLIEFSQVAIANATKASEQFPEDMLNRVQTKDNIALVALLETKTEPEKVHGLQPHGMVAQRQKPLLVCNCHIHWDPNFCDVKIVQTMMLMQELRKVVDNIDVRTTSTFPSSPTTSALDKVNLVLSGDFNSLQQSGVFSFIENGKINCTHPDFKGLNYEGYLGTNSREKLSSVPSSETATTSLRTEEFQHDFKLNSAYPPDTMPFTNYTLEFQGVIDYIFSSVKGLRPLGLLGPLDSSWLIHNNIVGFPHPCIPSDHLPLLVELETTPAISN